MVAQWNHKAAYASAARSLSTKLARDTVAEFLHRVRRELDDALPIFNPLPFCTNRRGTHTDGDNYEDDRTIVPLVAT